MAERSGRDVALTAAKCVRSTGPLALGSWGGYGAEHAAKFEPSMRLIGSWICIVAMIVAVVAITYSVLNSFAETSAK